MDVSGRPRHLELDISNVFNFSWHPVTCHIPLLPNVTLSPPLYKVSLLCPLCSLCSLCSLRSDFDAHCPDVRRPWGVAGAHSSQHSYKYPQTQRHKQISWQQCHPSWVTRLGNICIMRKYPGTSDTLWAGECPRRRDVMTTCYECQCQWIYCQILFSHWVIFNMNFSFILFSWASVSWSHRLTRILCTYHLDVICFIEWKYWTNSDILPSTSKILFCRRVFCSLRLLVGVNINTLIPVARIWAQPLSH